MSWSVKSMEKRRGLLKKHTDRRAKSKDQRREEEAQKDMEKRAMIKHYCQLGWRSQHLGLFFLCKMLSQKDFGLGHNDMPYETMDKASLELGAFILYWSAKKDADRNDDDSHFYCEGKELLIGATGTRIPYNGQPWPTSPDLWRYDKEEETLYIKHITRSEKPLSKKSRDWYWGLFDSHEPWLDFHLTEDQLDSEMILIWFQDNMFRALWNGSLDDRPLKLESMSKGYLDTLKLPTSVYRLFNIDGVLLYIGMSATTMNRLLSHIKSKSWASQIAQTTIEHFPNRRIAKVVEKSAIQIENPLYNESRPKATEKDIIIYHEYCKHKVKPQ